MPRGDKSAYTAKQQRQAEHIEEGYEKKGVPKKEAEARAWATVNKESGGGKQSGSGRAKPSSSTDKSQSTASKKPGSPSRTRTAAERSASAKKAAQTRARNAQNAR